MLRLKIRLLGDYSAVDFHGNALSIGDIRTQALVIYLALRLEGKTSLKELAELLFDDRDAVIAVRGVIRKLSAALRFLPQDILLDDGQTVFFSRETVEADTQRFNHYIAVPSVKSTRRATEISSAPPVCCPTSKSRSRRFTKRSCASARNRVSS